MLFRSQANVETFAQATGADAVFVDTRPSFVTGGACLGADLRAINSLVLLHTPGDDPDKVPSAQSFHPNERGTQLYASAIEAALGWN